MNRLLNITGGASFGALFGALCSVVLAYAKLDVETISIFFIACVLIGAFFGATGKPKF